MSNLNRKVVQSYVYKDSYMIELFDTGLTIVFRKTDDGSTGLIGQTAVGRDKKPSKDKRSSAEEGHTLVLRVPGFTEQFHKGNAEKIVDLFEEFVQFSKLPITDRTKTIHLNYDQTQHEEFILSMLNNDEFSNLKKWCVIASALSSLPFLANNLNKEVLLSNAEQQIDPEKVTEWKNINESTQYFFPSFPNSGTTAMIRNGKTSSDSQNDQQYRKEKHQSIYVENVDQYKHYITINNFLKNPECETLEQAKNTGFYSHGEFFNPEDAMIVQFYISNAGKLNNFPNIKKDDLHKAASLLHSFPANMSSEIFCSAIQRILDSDTDFNKRNNRLLFLDDEDYSSFSAIVDEYMGDKREGFSNYRITTTVGFLSQLNSYSTKVQWEFWITMSNLYLKYGENDFTLMFSDWADLIEDSSSSGYGGKNTMNKLAKSKIVKEFFDMSASEGISVKYLWWLHKGIDS